MTVKFNDTAGRMGRLISVPKRRRDCKIKVATSAIFRLSFTYRRMDELISRVDENWIFSSVIFWFKDCFVCF